MSRSAALAALVLLIAVSTLPAVPASGQMVAAPRRDTFWVGVGLGVGSEDVGGQLNGSYQFGANLISLRAAVTAGPFDDGFNDYAGIPPPSSDCRLSCKRSGVPANR